MAAPRLFPPPAPITSAVPRAHHHAMMDAFQLSAMIRLTGYK
jgi:hypothetical protein